MEVWKRLERLKHLKQQALSRAAECREAVQRCEQQPSPSKMSEMIKTYQEGVDLNEEEAQMFGELIERDISEKKGVTCARKNDNIVLKERHRGISPWGLVYISPRQSVAS